jgi:hypothetical protein
MIPSFVFFYITLNLFLILVFWQLRVLLFNIFYGLCGFFCLYNVLVELAYFFSQCDNLFFKILNIFSFIHLLSLCDFISLLCFFNLDLQGDDFLFKSSFFLTKFCFNLIQVLISFLSMICQNIFSFLCFLSFGF